MKTFIAAQLGLAPLIAFWALLRFASPEAALAAGLAASLAMTAWRWRRREAYLIERGVLATFGVLAAFAFISPALSPPRLGRCRSPGSDWPLSSASH